MERIEQIILNALTTNSEFSRKVLPFIKEEYFAESSEEKILFGVIKEYIRKYGNPPSKAALYVEIDDIVNISENAFKELKKLVAVISDGDIKEHDSEWLLDQTERFCQDKALYNAIMESIQIVQGEANKNLTKTAIPHMLSEALGVSFDDRIGHNFTDDAEERYEYYHEKQVKIPFDIDLLNQITDGGLPKKSLTTILGGTGTGKSLFMCHMAANNLTDGKNVLYITLEMSENETARRIDANLLDVDINQIKNIPRSEYLKSVNAIKAQTLGKLIIREYPTASAHVGHFRHLLDELKLKKKFIPDIIYIDYINICTSSRLKQNGSVNSYVYVKAIAEEIRGLAVEFDVPVITATQTNREGFGSSEVELQNVSESFGLPATSDLMFAIISTEQLAELGQYMIKQLKNRYNDLNHLKKFLIGVDKPKMRLYNLDPVAQNSISSNQITHAASFSNNATKKPNPGSLIV